MISNILVTGGHGFIGSHLVERLLSQGERVSCLVRHTSNTRWIKNLNIRLIKGDLLNPSTLLSAVKDQEVIFHCAAALKGMTTDDFDKTNLNGTSNLLEAVKIANPNVKRIVILSSIAAIGPSPSENTFLTESDPCNPVSDYGKSKLKMEEMIQKKYINKLPITIIRPPWVFGPRDDKSLIFFKLAKYGIHIEYPKNRIMNLVYVKDLVKGMIAAAFSESAKGRTYFILDPHEHKWRVFLEAISSALGKKSVNINIPKPLLKIMATGADIIAKIRQEASFFGREKLQDMENPYWLYSSSKAREDFHFENYTPLDIAVKETTNWYKEQRWI